MWIGQDNAIYMNIERSSCGNELVFVHSHRKIISRARWLQSLKELQYSYK